MSHTREIKVDICVMLVMFGSCLGHVFAMFCVCLADVWSMVGPCECGVGAMIWQ